MTLKDRIQSLPAEQQRQLYYAFEHGIAQYVEVDQASFVGVNVDKIKNLQVEDKAGAWSFGTISGRFSL